MGKLCGDGNVQYLNCGVDFMGQILNYPTLNMYSIYSVSKLISINQLFYIGVIFKSLQDCGNKMLASLVPTTQNISLLSGNQKRHH